MSTKIVQEVAKQAARSVTRKVIAALQKMTNTLSGDDSELKSTWDEICVQLQDEESGAWDAYDHTVRALVRSHIEVLPQHEQEAIWLQTEEGFGWPWNDEAQGDTPPIVTDDLVNYLATDYVYEEAGRWSNRRIRAYIERSSM